MLKEINRNGIIMQGSQYSSPLMNYSTGVPGGGEMCTGARGDLVFVIDSSGSIRDSNPSDGSYDNWNLILGFLNDFVDRLPISTDDYRVGIVK